jgi:hypothetical protein
MNLSVGEALPNRVNPRLELPQFSEHFIATPLLPPLLYNGLQCS